jgi:hypothetical protein
MRAASTSLVAFLFSAVVSAQGAAGAAAPASQPEQLATVRDLATFEQPNQLSQGMDYVFVNGVPVIAAGKMSGALPGKVLRGPVYTF